MAATAVFQRRNIDLFKTIMLRFPRSRYCSVDRSDEEQPNGNISDDPETVSQGKKLDLVVPSLRVDRVLASALGMGRRSVVNTSVWGNCLKHHVPFGILYCSIYTIGTAISENIHFHTPRRDWNFHGAGPNASIEIDHRKTNR